MLSYILQSYSPPLTFLEQNNHVKVAVVADPQASSPSSIILCNFAVKPAIVCSDYFEYVAPSWKGLHLQLMDSTSLGLPSSSVALQAAEFYTDLNMRRSFQSTILPFKPDVVLFLGDHFDGGPYMPDEE